MDNAARTKIFHLFRTTALLVVFILSSTTSFASTLFEESRVMLADQEQKASPRDYTFVVMGDSRDNDGVFRKALALAATFRPLFILHLGDFSRSGSQPEVDHFLGMVRNVVPGIPLFVAKGNHEQTRPFKEKIGPLDYVIDSASLGLRVVVLNNSDYRLRPPQQTFLEQNLTAHRRLSFVAMHVPPETKRWTWHAFSNGAAEMRRLLSEKKVAAAFYGHVHLYDRDVLDGVEQIITGGAGAPLITSGFPGSPLHHIIVVQVKDGAVSCRMIEVE